MASHKTLHPIDDLDERASKKGYSEAERQLRCQLASAYRLIDFYDWSEGVYNHITCRLPGDGDHFLINPFGLLYHEITASSLITLDARGDILDRGSTRFGINERGFTLHSAIHMARKDAHCVLHLHLPEVIAISCMQEGFVALCQEGLSIGPVPSLEFKGILTELEERKCIAEALGQNDALLLKNHGFVVCGETIADAMLKTYWFIYNVRAQLHLAPVGISSKNVSLPDSEAAKRTYQFLRQGEKTLNSGGQKSQDIHWGPGGLDWEANMRLLDSMGLKTGYKYRLPVWRDNV